MNEKRLKKYEYLSSKIRTQFFIIWVQTYKWVFFPMRFKNSLN